jgi:hypothetical protein
VDPARAGQASRYCLGGSAAKFANPLAFTPTNELFSSRKGWCDEPNLRPGGSNAFSDALVDRGYTTMKRAHGGCEAFASW